MQKRVTLILEPEDIALITRVSKDPCASCNREIIWCHKCPLKKKYNELLNSIPEDNMELILELAYKYRDYTETVKNINEFCEKLEQLKSEYNIDKLDSENETIYVTQTSDKIDLKLNNGVM